MKSKNVFPKPPEPIQETSIFPLWLYNPYPMKLASEGRLVDEYDSIERYVTYHYVQKTIGSLPVFLGIEVWQWIGHHSKDKFFESEAGFKKWLDGRALTIKESRGVK
jgi:hypothetical protein